MHSKSVGELSEQFIIANLLKLGLVVSKLIGDNQPYDLIIDFNRRLFKVQIKTGTLENGVVKFKAVRSRINTNQHFLNHYTAEEVDLFMIYCIELDKCYFVPFEICPAFNVFLRIDDTKNSQAKNIRFAKEFEFGNLIEFLNSIPFARTTKR
jgi:hypothetical protein